MISVRFILEVINQCNLLHKYAKQVFLLNQVSVIMECHRCCSCYFIFVQINKFSDQAKLTMSLGLDLVHKYVVGKQTKTLHFS